MATMVFAEPVALASGIVQSTDLTAQTDPLDPLFSDVEAPQLTELEADAIEGDGWKAELSFGALGGIVGAGIGAVYGFFSNFQYGPTATFYGLRTGLGMGLCMELGLGFWLAWRSRFLLKML
jgi:hypothetical protein